MRRNSVSDPFRPREERKLTADQILALRSLHDLTDAHVQYNSASGDMHNLTAEIQALFTEARNISQHEADVRGARAFFKISNQSIEDWFLPVYSASVSTEIVANVLRLRGHSVALVEPTFDCIADILKRQQLAPRAVRLDGKLGYLDTMLAFLAVNKDIDSLFIVNPNNPTGDILDEQAFTTLCKACRDSNTMLIIDSSFRLFDESTMFDQYAILEEIGTEFIGIEDTGKVWATLDLKLSYLTASLTLRGDIENVRNDLLLNVSPFVSILVEHMSARYPEESLFPIRRLIGSNRAALRDTVDSLSGVRVAFPNSRVSVEMLRVDSRMSSAEIVEHLREHSVSVLSGDAFYWSDRSRGTRDIRIALARSSEYFGDALAALHEHWPLSQPPSLKW